MINREHLFYLFDRYIQNTCTLSEKQAFLQLLADPAYEEAFREINDTYPELPSNHVQLDESTTNAVWDAIQQGIPLEQEQEQLPPRIGWRRPWWAAAAVLVLVAGSLFWLNRPSSVNGDTPAVASQTNIEPGTDGAVLTLSDGRTLVLDSMADGLVARQKGAAVQLLDGQLSYEEDEKTLNDRTPSAGDGRVTMFKPENTPVYNTITTPRGRQFKMVLPDGTKVWLNAASSMRFPTAFIGRERTVEVDGEVYFEVAPGAKPFLVNVNNRIRVEVLGTHFNVNAYRDEHFITTSLLQGKVRIVPTIYQSKFKPTVLVPGEQLRIAEEASVKYGDGADISTAWTKGLFSFKKADLKSVLRQIARWYDVEINYQDEVSRTFSGSIYRTENFEEVLKTIEFTCNVQLTLNNKTVTVTANE